MVDEVSLPAINALIEVSVFGGDSYKSRVEDLDNGVITVAAPLNLRVTEVPDVGDKLTVRWPAGPRGRYAVTGSIVEVTSGAVPRWAMRPEGAPKIEQSRSFVRGGGNEPLKVQRIKPDGEPASGRVIDISEGGIRARFDQLELGAGDEVHVTVELGDDVLGTEGRVLRTWQDGEDEAETFVVIVFEPHERDARVIRRYVLRHQLMMRNGRLND
ncbi:c-di-GMP-binding flagellar brake protein YcgR, contains PilZNR and PilZ domains [Micromonospora pattaloongensis]|uniref:C-di-GMP-binding flagellar brake protein YcgR, contains PilZNR and PilZ domains n=1 Tax=Micromonospora pattaloongensis TaxID=405436 RepID=A0A1H3LVB0_9ACTN|nr:PilZ domain-containing protein [Micromonospora pattaloongensis]SDY68477.1 c-di-GMP-binding flagellar brake protein YcgR, contains PilZNR and PilZ domains [Micromonospora pattaloongensis]